MLLHKVGKRKCMWVAELCVEVCMCVLTLRPADEPLHSFDDLVSVSVGVYADLLQLTVTHLHQHIQSNLHTHVLLFIGMWHF